MSALLDYDGLAQRYGLSRRYVRDTLTKRPEFPAPAMPASGLPDAHLSSVYYQLDPVNPYNATRPRIGVHDEGCHMSASRPVQRSESKPKLTSDLKHVRRIHAIHRSGRASDFDFARLCDAPRLPIEYQGQRNHVVSPGVDYDL